MFSYRKSNSYNSFLGQSIVISLFVIISVSTQAQSQVWKISKDSTTFYLGGSIHLLRPNDVIPAAFDTAFNNSTKIIFETSIDSLSNQEVSNRMLQSGQFKDDKTLQSVLSSKTYTKLSDKLLEHGIPIIGFNKFKPSMVILTLTVMELQKKGLSGDGVDKQYFEKAKSASKEVDQLEAVGTQIQILTAMGDGYEDKFVNHMLKDLKKKIFEPEVLVKAWTTGDIKFLGKELDDLKNIAPILYEDLIVKRNNNWINTIPNKIKHTECAFIIVGYLHLIGEDGLITHYKNQGYSVEPIYFP